MTDPITDIKTGRRLWSIFTRAREALQQIEKIGEALLHIDALDKRVAELEKRLERCPGEACPKCGELAFRVERSEQITAIGDLYKRHMKCEKCGFAETWRWEPPTFRKPGRR